MEQEKSELTNKCKELEQKQILVLVSKPVKTDGVLGIMRSRSEGTYTEVNQPTLTSFFSEDHKVTSVLDEVFSFKNYVCMWFLLLCRELVASVILKQMKFVAKLQVPVKKK